MADGNLLQFRPRSRVPHDVLYIFPTDQLLNATPAMRVLERQGVPDPQGLVRPCLQGQLEQIAVSEEPPAMFSRAYVSVQHATYDVDRAFRENVEDLQTYGLGRLIAKAVYLIQLEGCVGGHHLTFNGMMKEAWDKYNRWKLDGATRTLARHLETNAPLARTIIDDNRNRPVYAMYGLQTADDAFVLEKTELKGPLDVHRWGGKIVITGMEDASDSTGG